MDPAIAHAGARTSDQATLAIFRALLAIQVLAAGAFGLGPFVAPEAFASLGGLTGTEPFIYRLAGAATLGYGVAALIALLRPSWERVRIPIAATTAFNAAAVLATLLSIADGESAWIVWFILVAASVFTLIGGFWLVRNQGPAEDRPRPVGGTFRLVLGIATLAAIVFGAVPLVFAEAAASFGGFDTTELFPYRMAGAATLGYAAAGILQLQARAVRAIRLQVIAALVFNALSAVAVAIYLFGGGTAPIAILIGAAATAFSVAFAAWLVQDPIRLPGGSRMSTPAYERLTGLAALLAGAGGLIYSVAFIGGVVLEWAPELGITIASTALLIGGVLTLAVLVAIYGRVRAVAPELAALGLLLGAAGAIGASVHGGYDLANVLHPPIIDVLSVNELPNPLDPRGLLTFGFAGLGLLALAWLLRRSGTTPERLGSLGMVVGALLVVVYLGRLIVLDPTNPLVAGPAALVGFVLSPAFYLWLGSVLRRP